MFECVSKASEKNWEPNPLTANFDGTIVHCVADRYEKQAAILCTVVVNM